jgi:hypothetical protein
LHPALSEREICWMEGVWVIFRVEGIYVVYGVI